jgi:hypothetical protein
MSVVCPVYSLLTYIEVNYLQMYQINATFALLLNTEKTGFSNIFSSY